MTTVDFYKLPRAVQERLLDSLRGRFAPHPILTRPGTRPRAFIWLGISMLAALIEGMLYGLGFGKAESAMSIHGIPMLIVHCALISTVAIGILNAASARVRARALPFAPGLYLFPSELIDAREYELGVHPLTELTQVSSGLGASVVLSFGLRRFSLPLADASRGKEAIAVIEAARERMKGLDQKSRFELDPLEPPSMVSPIASQVPLKLETPLWEKQRLVLGALIGIALGVAVYQLRNTASDNRMYAVAHEKNDIASFKAYLARGKRHKQGIAQILLPRAELKAAVEKHSVEAIDAFIREHPKTGIEGEVLAARQAALVEEFGRVREAGTLAALLGYAEKYPDHGIGAPFNQAKHALYSRAFDKFKTEAAADPEVVDFMSRLLIYSEKTGAHKTDAGLRGPAVQIRFQRTNTSALERADTAIRKNPMFNGVTSLATRYFDQARLDPYEQELSKALAERFSKSFPPEILSFEAGPRAEAEGDALPAVTTPTLFVIYKVEWSGGAFASKKPRAILIGLFFFFKTEFVIPGDANTSKSKYTAAQNIPQGILEQQPATPTPGTVETTVYDAMTKGGFDEFRDKYLAKWFKEYEAKK